VALSGGYQDDEDHGEWFLYTGRFVFRLLLDRMVLVFDAIVCIESIIFIHQLLGYFQS